MFRHESVFVKPGAGRVVPLPVPGGSIKVPAEGKVIERDFHVERLISCGDLVVGKLPAAPSADEPVAETSKVKGA
jgi:hypothetical protein